MKKKTLSLLFAVLLLIQCTFILVSCGGGGGPQLEEWEKGAITEENWKNYISTDVFYIENGEATKENSANTYKLHYINGIYFVRGSNYENNFKAVSNGTTTVYQQLVKGANGEELQDITEDAYLESLKNYTSLLNYVKNNQAKFTFFNDAGSGRYKLDVAGSEIASTVEAIRTQMRLTAYAIDYIKVAFYTYSGFSISFWNNDGQHILDITFPKTTFSFYMESVASSLSEYTVKGGPSLTDLAYTEITVNENGFYKINPNQDQNTAGSTVYGKYISEGENAGKYQVWSGGNWSYEFDKSYYLETYFNPLVKCYMGDMLTTGEYNISVNGDLVRTSNCSYSIGYSEYKYSNVVIELDGNNNIEKITWKLQIHDNRYNADSEIYDMTLTVGKTAIDFPN